MPSKHGARCHLFVHLYVHLCKCEGDISSNRLGPLFKFLSKLSMLCRSIPGSIVNFVSLEFGVIIDIACALALIEAFVSLSKFVLFLRWTCLRFLACSFFPLCTILFNKICLIFFLAESFLFVSRSLRNLLGRKIPEFLHISCFLGKIHLYMQIGETDFMICF